MELRPYQDAAIHELYAWFKENKTGNPVVCLPGGSGKSVVIGKFVEGAVKKWPRLRVLMLVHSKELIAQNADKLRKIWPNAPLGIYSASLGKRQLDEPIIYGGIQSLRTKADKLGHIDLMIVDEAHCISNEESGGYRTLIAQLKEVNPKMRVIGFTASPYRVGQGMLTDGDLFDDILEPVTIKELIDLKHLTPLSSKVTDTKLDAAGVKKSGGDYQAKAMQDRFNTDDYNASVADEIIEKAALRKHWLIFCSGVEHARDFAEALKNRGIAADYVTGKDSVKDRDAKIAAFETGEIRALCNVGILTTGYDFPALDCIAMLRATTSPGLYLQIAVRGMRIYPGKKNCLVLDFCGNVGTHGPVTHVVPPRKKCEKGGDSPVRLCPECDEILHLSCKVCTSCGFEFPKVEKQYFLSKDCIMGEPKPMAVTRWHWSKHVSRTSGNEMVKVTYCGALSDPSISEYFAVKNGGYAEKKAFQKLNDILARCGLSHIVDKTESLKSDSAAQWPIQGFCDYVNKNGVVPDSIEHIKNGKFSEVASREWDLKKKVIELYKSGEHHSKITEKTGYKKATIFKIVQGIESPDQIKKRKQKQQALRMIKNGVKQTVIAKTLNVNRMTVAAWIKEQGSWIDQNTSSNESLLAGSDRHTAQ